jgi:hypothetical protein
VTIRGSQRPAIPAIFVVKKGSIILILMHPVRFAILGTQVQTVLDSAMVADRSKTELACQMDMEAQHSSRCQAVWTS